MPQSIQSALASWRTTAAGLALVLAVALEVLARLFGIGEIPEIQLPDWFRMVAEFAGGGGLIASRDNRVSSEKAGAE